jgi:heme-degrading monooxygenase HmoA
MGIATGIQVTLTWPGLGYRLAFSHPSDPIMILELADIRIQPGQQTAFEQAIELGLNTVASRAKGFRGAKVNRCIETPERFVLQIFWDTLEDHTVGFRQSPLFTEWRAIVGPFFAAPPHVEHFELTYTSA